MWGVRTFGREGMAPSCCLSPRPCITQSPALALAALWCLTENISPPSLFKAALDLSFCSFVKWVFFSSAFLIKFLEKCSGQHLRLRINRNKSVLLVWLALEFSLVSIPDTVYLESNPSAGNYLKFYFFD